MGIRLIHVLFMVLEKAERLDRIRLGLPGCLPGQRLLVCSLQRIPNGPNLQL